MFVLRNICVIEFSMKNAKYCEIQIIFDICNKMIFLTGLQYFMIYKIEPYICGPQCPF